jgi:glycosyltransferase involved in cell wall biosynthesis
MARNYSTKINLEQKTPVEIMKKNADHVSKIGFLAAYNIYDDKYVFSPARFLFEGLGNLLGEISFIPPAIWEIPLIEKIRRKLIGIYFKNSNQIYRFETDPIVAAHLSQYYHHQFEINHYDLIISWFTTFELSRIKSNIPLVIFRDAVFPSLVNKYEGFFNIPAICVKNGKSLEQQAFDHTDILYFTSEWGIKEFYNYYNLHNSKKTTLKTVMVGPNLRDIPNYRNIQDIRLANEYKYYRFFLPVTEGGWFRKGGDTAYQIVKSLNQTGIPSKLTVCGDVPESYRSYPDVEVLPYMNKNDKQQLRVFQEMLINSDFLLFPTNADFTPHIICEANAFGTPVITTRIAGIPEMVTDGKNGFLLSPDAEVDDFVNVITQAISVPEAYEELRCNSRNVFEKKLNWDITCKHVANEIADLLQ